jgi:hypothetical protein
MWNVVRVEPRRRSLGTYFRVSPQQVNVGIAMILDRIFDDVPRRDPQAVGVDVER